LEQVLLVLLEQRVIKVPQVRWEQDILVLLAQLGIKVLRVLWEQAIRVLLGQQDPQEQLGRQVELDKLDKLDRQVELAPPV
jgi:hypothetical protein